MPDTNRPLSVDARCSECPRQTNLLLYGHGMTRLFPEALSLVDKLLENRCVECGGRLRVTGIFGWSPKNRFNHLTLVPGLAYNLNIRKIICGEHDGSQEEEETSPTQSAAAR